MEQRRPDAPDAMLKRVDAWWTVLAIDPLTVPLVRRMRDLRWITPTRLTFAAHALGLGSGALFALGWFVAAAVLFEVRFVLDCADGKLARLRRSPSPAGAFLDYVGDYLVVGVVLVGFAGALQADGVIPVGLAMALPVSFLTSIAAGQAAVAEAAARGEPVPLLSDRVSGRYRSWMTRHRLKPLPSRIEVEHGTLFVAPLLWAVTDADAVLLVAAAAGAGYFALQTVHLVIKGFLVARSRE